MHTEKISEEELKKDISQKTPIADMLRLAEDNGLKPFGDFVRPGSYAIMHNGHSYMFYKENLGLITIDCFDGYVSNISLHLNVTLKKEYDPDKSEYLSQNSTSAYAYGDEKSFYTKTLTCKKQLINAIDELKENYNLFFPFLYNKYTPGDFIDDSIVEKHKDKINYVSEDKFDRRVEVFKYLIGDKFSLLDPHNGAERKTGYYNTEQLIPWSDLIRYSLTQKNKNDEPRQKLRQPKSKNTSKKYTDPFNKVDRDFYDTVKYLLLANEVDNNIKEILSSPVVHHTTELGHNIGHVMAIMRNSEIKQSLYEKIDSFNSEEQKIIFSQPDKVGLTPILLMVKYHNMRLFDSEELKEQNLHYFRKCIEKDISSACLGNEKAGFWNCAHYMMKPEQAKVFADIILENDKIIPHEFHVYDRPFSSGNQLTNVATSKTDIINALNRGNFDNVYEYAQKKQHAIDMFNELQQELPIYQMPISKRNKV